MPHVDLLELPYFEGISLDAIVELVDLMEPRYYRAGEVIIQEGSQTPPPLYIATSGQVLINKQTPEHNSNRELAALHSPTVFGEIELFCQIPPVATVHASSAVSAFMLTRQTFDRLFAEQVPALMLFTFNVARVACHRLVICNEILTGFISNDDLVKRRDEVYRRIKGSEDPTWPHITGVFRLPSKR